MALQKVVHNIESEPIFIKTSFLLLNSMVKQENKEGFIMNVTQIPANPLFGFKPYKKVAAYCRVSTQQEIQHHSLVAQREYFEQFIYHPAATGCLSVYTQTKRRDETMRI